MKNKKMERMMILEFVDGVLSFVCVLCLILGMGYGMYAKAAFYMAVVIYIQMVIDKLMVNAK